MDDHLTRRGSFSRELHVRRDFECAKIRKEIIYLITKLRGTSWVSHFFETFLRRGMILGRDFVSLRCTVLCRKVETNFYYVILYVWRLRDLPFLLREVKDHLTNSSFEKSSLFVLLESKLFRTKDSRRKEGYVKNVREKREDRYISSFDYWVLEIYRRKTN